MEPLEQLRQIVAQLCGTQSSEIGSDFSLRSRGLQSSVRRAALAASIRRRLKVTCPEIYTATTFGALQAAVFGNAAEPHLAAAKPMQQPGKEVGARSMPSDDLACGIDLETVAALPAAVDYWEHEFYRDTFSKDEIAYCVLQEDPRMHFAARWCAKEALIKCDSTFKGEPLANIEVIRSRSGEISLTHHANGTSRKLPVAVSITHTDTMVAAVVVRKKHNG